VTARRDDCIYEPIHKREKTMTKPTNPTAPAENLFSLTGKIAVVTGGGAGLGKIFAETLAEYGAAVAIADIDGDAARRTAADIGESGGRSLAVTADVRAEDGVQQLVAEVADHFGAIDIWVNNAGITAPGNRVADLPIEDWDRVMALNLRGVFLCTRAVLPVMVKQQRGVIINVASVYGIRPFFEIGQLKPNAPYAASKAAVISLTKETAQEYARDGIRVNCVAPGWHEGTRLGAALEESGEKERLRRYEETLLRTTPMGRKGDPRELRGLLLYLASDASSFVTGQVFVSDGGISI
jgi:NAD(P)-dependent dehydrogenase (short-subunit alcohol dehydrogenase family)